MQYETEIELSEVLDVQKIQMLMDSFYKLTHIPMSIIDLKGNVLVGVGWQKICILFHRAHHITKKYCIESDLELSKNIPRGEFKLYKCKNNMWDISSPLIIGDKCIGNIFIGQFFFDDEIIDYSYFRDQAKKYGFDEAQYISALESVPRISRETLSTAMEFFLKFASVLSQLSFSNMELLKLLGENDKLMNSLRTSQTTLERYNKDLETFAYSASHDLQEPIRMIKSYAQLIDLRQKDKLDASTREYLRFITDGASRMQQLVNGLLNYSRISSFAYDDELTDCNLVLKDVIEDLKFRIADESAKITVHKLPVVNGNYTHLRQLFQNLIHNALKFRSDKNPEIIISCKSHEGKHVFSVCDNGIGIEKMYFPS